MKLCLVLCLVVIANSVHCKKTNGGFRGMFSKAYSYTMESRQHNNIMIPVVIYFDEALTDQLAKKGKMNTRRQAWKISKKMLDQAAYYFRLPSLNLSVHFNMDEPIFLKHKFLKMDAFFAWQEEQKRMNNDWWYSILLTGMDLLYYNTEGGKIRNIAGFSYLGEVCSKDLSCAVLEWHPKEMGFLLAHELGHSLGINHDGLPYNKCKLQGNVMSSSYNSLPKTWSQCSKQYLESFLLGRESWCLRNVNIQQNFN